MTADQFLFGAFLGLGAWVFAHLTTQARKQAIEAHLFKLKRAKPPDSDAGGANADSQSGTSEAIPK